MASINFDKMSLKELRDLQAKVEKAIIVARQRERAAALKKAEAAAASAGFSLSELLGAVAAAARASRRRNTQIPTIPRKRGQGAVASRTG